MKTYEQLDSTQQAIAVEKCLNLLLNGILEGFPRFNDAMNGDNLQAAIDAAIAEAEEKQIPWFARQFIMSAEYTMDGCSNETVGEVLRGMAQCDAEDSFYPEPHERIIQL